MRSTTIGAGRGATLLGILSLVALAACTSSPAPSVSSAASLAPASQTAASEVPATEVPTETASAEPSGAEASETPAPTAVATSIDPCQLLPKDEASKLAGVTFTAGEESTEDNTRRCTYGARTPNVFMVVVAVAPDQATAKAQEQDFQAQLQEAASQLPQGMKVTQLPGFAPGADAALFEGTATISGQTIGGSAIYVLRGTTFFGFSDIALNHAPPSADAVKTEAMTLLGRLP